MALRTYHYRVARLAECATDRGQSLWAAVFRYIQESGPVLRADVQQRFARDDAEMVQGVLRDLVESRLLYRTGRAESTTYRIATEELDRDRDDLELEGGSVLEVSGPIRSRTGGASTRGRRI